LDTIAAFVTPQLALLHRGKVRDSYRIDERTRLIVVSDRLSAFDRVLETPIRHKGAVLSCLSNWWFESTAAICPNHLVRQIDPNLTLVAEAKPIKVEVVVRGYITGSMWRAYAQGKRSFSGQSVPDGLQRNQRLPVPLVTPTTKEEVDREITPPAIVAEGLASSALWEQMAATALRLFAFGSERLAARGLLLADTKYEFGTVGDRLMLIDEIHTPDSSRLWPADQYQRDPLAVESLDKEYVRAWILQTEHGGGPRVMALPAEVAAETSRRYLQLYERVTGAALPLDDEPPRARMVRNLVAAGLIKDGYVAICLGSPADQEHAATIADVLTRHDVAVDWRVVSAHKNGEQIMRLAAEYNHSAEPGACIAIAGLSNGLGGALAANLTIPVISCPPFKDTADLLANINSSLLLPSRTPAATVVRPENAALLALRCLNLPRLRAAFGREIAVMKDDLAAHDRRVRGRG